jgi:hypothetical protein
MNGLCWRIHLAQVAAVGGCDGLVSALGLLILLLLLLLQQACSVAGAHWWYSPSPMTARLLLHPHSHAVCGLHFSCAGSYLQLCAEMW